MQINRLPFFYKTLPTPDNGGFPMDFPFLLYWDEALGIFRQQATPELEALMQQVYAQGTLIEGSLSNESGLVYRQGILDFIRQQGGNLQELDYLEVGCGTGVLLKELQPFCRSVIGVEPGAHGVVEGLDPALVIRDFFPSTRIHSKFHIICHFGVLEHIADVDAFLSNQRDHLHSGGKLIIAVPNCEPYYAEGDISMFIHEHYNYFTRNSLQRLAKRLGMRVRATEIFEGMIFACVELGQDEGAEVGPSFSYAAFDRLANELQTRLQQLITPYAAEKIAIYVPIRALNTLYLLGSKNLRLVDDSTQSQGKYLPWMSARIASLDQLLQNPPELLLIYSRTFGQRIKERCQSLPALQNTRIMTIHEV